MTTGLEPAGIIGIVLELTDIVFIVFEAAETPCVEVFPQGVLEAVLGPCDSLRVVNELPDIIETVLDPTAIEAVPEPVPDIIFDVSVPEGAVMVPEPRTDESLASVMLVVVRKE